MCSVISELCVLSGLCVLLSEWICVRYVVDVFMMCLICVSGLMYDVCLCVMSCACAF